MDAMQLGKSKNPQGVPFDVRFGESQVPVGCASCERFDKYGFFIVLGAKATLICIRCTAAAIVKLQDMHPDAKLFDVDVNVDEKEFSAAVAAVKKALPQLSDSQALEAAKAALYAI